MGTGGLDFRRRVHEGACQEEAPHRDAGGVAWAWGSFREGAKLQRALNPKFLSPYTLKP